MKRKFRFGLICAISIAALLYSCTKSPQDLILGKWYEIDKENAGKIWEFFKDGRLVLQGFNLFLLVTGGKEQYGKESDS